MRICQLEVQNFRGVKNGKVVFPDHSVLFGPNNVGKSTIIEALALLFERERLTRQLSDWDFYGGLPNPDSRFYIIGTITDFAAPPQDEPENFPKWFLGDAARPVWWQPDVQLVSVEVDRPPGAKLAGQIALCVRYDQESCEFEPIRYFYYGPCDPFTDNITKLPAVVLQELGVFLLPSNRQWDKLLSFNSSSFLKVLKSANAIPGTAVESLKSELRSTTTKIEDATQFKALLEKAEEELKGFLMLDSGGRLVYRTTSLDTLAVLQSQVPHILRSDNSLLPFARHGAGMISLQAFLIVLAFAEQRKTQGKNFIFAAEEPELHLHPALHRRLANRIRSLSTQSITTTHSPVVAASYQAASSLFVRNTDGNLAVVPVRKSGLAEPARNAVRNLYRKFREPFYEALMGAIVLVPEGESDFEWLRLWQRVAEASDEVAALCSLTPITIIPTSDAAITDTIAEINRFRTDAIALVDGDTTGDAYIICMEQATCRPTNIIQYGVGAAVECLCAWILEPALSAPGAVLSNLLTTSQRSLGSLQAILVSKKDDRQLREDLCWEAIETPACALRAGQFLEDIACIAAGSPPKDSRWTSTTLASGTRLFKANHIASV
jgi:putative ATP-dependent endonuclease of the OLD family